ncbi:MAG: hypothetical protein HXX81_05800 [Campylobacterales bacterium]|nr:hypothetical protein [Campylobacterales bacterium]
MKKFVLFLYLIFNIIAHAEITNYKANSGFIKINSNNFLILRSFKQDNQNYLLVANVDTLETKIVKNSFLIDTNISKLFNSTLFNMLNKYNIQTQNSYQNSGLKNSSQNCDGYFLTVDMCPSNKYGFEKEFFEKLLEYKNIAICLTKKWAIQHKNEFEWLKKMQQEKKLNITWVNHSTNHFYDKTLPFEKNFLLHDKENFLNEIFETEKFMIENGLIPSLFFRFPGLVSDSEVIDKLKALYLLPLGANSWLAKGEKPTLGSIILVHGNLNEPKGIKLCNQFLDSVRPKLLKLNDIR